MMDWWPVVKIIWGGIGFGMACLLMVVAWRARRAISWNRTIRKELNALAVEAERASADRKRAIGLIIETCENISRSLSPEQAADAERLRTFVRSIAACFFPHVERPELQISLDHLIKSLDASLHRFDRILHQPGLKRIHAINIRNIRSLYHWSSALIERPFFRWYLAHRKKIQRFALIRLFIVPDPLSWLLFLSRKLMVLVLMKLLLVDITLFAGRLALDAFDQQGLGPREVSPESIEDTLEAISHVDVAAAMETDPDIAGIRRKLVGFSSVLLSNPSWQDFKTAVRKAAEIVARRHFPDAEQPLEEAAIGPLLDRTRSLLGTLGRGSNLVVVRHVYQIRLETLLQAKDLGDLVLTPTVRGMLRTSFSAYGWVKWPIKIYRRVKRFSLPGIAADVGWVLGKKSALILLYGRAFDHACRELDRVYRNSALMAGSGSSQRPDTDSVSPGETRDAVR